MYGTRQSTFPSQVLVLLRVAPCYRRSLQCMLIHLGHGRTLESYHTSCSLGCNSEAAGYIINLGCTHTAKEHCKDSAGPAQDSRIIIVMVAGRMGSGCIPGCCNPGCTSRFLSSIVDLE